MNTIKKSQSLFKKSVILVLMLLLLSAKAWCQDHDLVIEPAPDITSLDATDWKSPDIKLGSDFGDATAPDMVKRGVPNSIFAKFRINGTQDHTIPSGDIQVKFYYRSANIGDTPPTLDHPSWQYIDRLLVTYITADGPFAVTRIWPTDFPSVTTRSIDWTPPETGDYFHVAAELVYPSGTDDVNPDDNVAVSLYESQSGLIDVVFLFDVSGSMKYFKYNGFTYLDLAKSKAAMFISSMTEAHRLGVVAFSSRFGGGSEDVWDAPAPLLEPAGDANKISAGAAISDPGLSASGSTPLGQGLERAMDILTAESNPDRKKVILLLSDGYENSGTPRACAGGDLSNPCLSSSVLAQLQANNIRVFSIALGSSAWTECLECLSGESGGGWYASPDASLDLADILLAIHEAYTGDDLYRVDRGVSGGGGDTYSTYFEGKDNVLYFILSWDDLDAELNLNLVPPRRTRLKTKIFKGAGYRVVKVVNPIKGEWRYTVNGDSGKDYLAAVRSDKVGVRMVMDVKLKGRVGENVEIMARITTGNKPVTNAKPVAMVQIPVAPSLDTILQSASRNHILKYQRLPVSQTTLKKNPDVSSRAALIKQISKDSRKSPVKTRIRKVSLKHRGNGIYTGILSQKFTTTAGQYQVTVTTANKRYHRNFSKQVRLHPGKVDHERSFAEINMVTSSKRKTDWLLRVYAFDKFGNALTHPTLLKRVKVQVKNARLFRTPEIKFGAVQRKLSVTGKEKPVLEGVSIDGKSLKIKRSK